MNFKDYAGDRLNVIPSDDPRKPGLRFFTNAFPVLLTPNAARALADAIYVRYPMAVPVQETTVEGTLHRGRL